MANISKAYMLLASVASVSLMATDAEAATAKEKQLEARIDALERAFGSLQGELQSSRTENADLKAQLTAATAQVSQVQAAVDTVQADQAAKPAPAPDGFTSGNGATRIKLGGYLKMVAAMSHFSNGSVTTNTLGRDFYLPQAIPTAATGRSFTTEDFTAKQTRLWLNLDTNVAGHVVKGYLETDFQTTASAIENVAAGGSQRTTNGYTLALRRATMSVDRFTVGQDWTTFQYTAALPESTDYVGGSEGTIFVRQPLIRYTAPLSKQVSLMVGVENPESALATSGSAALLESGTDRLPDLTTRLTYSGARGEVSLARLVRQVRGESTGAALVNNTSVAGAVGNGLTKAGFGVSLGGKLFLNPAKASDVRFIATYGQNIGRYVGLNFAPDAVYYPAINALTDVRVFAALASAHLAIAPQVRANLMGSVQHVSYDAALPVASLAGLNKEAWSLAANLFWSPVKSIDLGLEYRHGERTLVSGANGQLDRVEFAAKYNF